MDEAEKKKQHNEDILNAGIAGASYETVQRFGSAVKEHFVAYLGIDNEKKPDENELAKGLKKISEEKINPDFEFQNKHQQMGFSAEVKDVARTNAENIINRNPTRKIRTDDLKRKNDPYGDTVMLDANGKEIDGTEAQMKFIGASKSDPVHEGDARRALNKLKSEKFKKYLDKDEKLDVPSDQYKQIIEEADAKIKYLSKQLEKQKEQGNTESVARIKGEIDKLEKIKCNLR